MSGLVGWWPLHETSGDTAYDLSGNQNHGSLNGGVTHGVAGRAGLSAYSFDGENDYVNTTTLGNFGSQLDTDLTISFWFKTETTGDDEMFMGTHNDGSSTYVAVYHNWDGQEGEIEFSISDDDRNQLWIGSGDYLVNDGEWHHVTITKTSNTSEGLAMWIDGEKIDNVIHRYAELNNPSNFNYPLRLGADNDRGDLRGPIAANICEVRIYNRALSPSEIQELYRQGSQDLHKKSLSDGTDSGAVSRWKLSDGGADGSTAVDSWGSNDGTINGAAFTDNSVRNDGRALQFDGEDDFVETDSLGDFHQSSKLSSTASVWIKTNDSSDVTYVFGASEPEDRNNYKLSVGQGYSGTVGKPTFIINDNNSDDNVVEIDKYVNNGVWHHVVFVVNGSDSSDIQGYLNGAAVKTDIIRDSLDEDNLESVSKNFVIGARNRDGEIIQHYTGLMSDLRIFNRALEPWEVFELYRWGSLGKDMRKELVNKKGNGDGQ